MIVLIVQSISCIRMFFQSEIKFNNQCFVSSQFLEHRFLRIQFDHHFDSIGISFLRSLYPFHILSSPEYVIQILKVFLLIVAIVHPIIQKYIHITPWQPCPSHIWTIDFKWHILLHNLNMLLQYPYLSINIYSYLLKVLLTILIVFFYFYC